MPMMMEQFSCAAGDVAQFQARLSAATFTSGSWQTDGNSFFKLWSCDFTELFFFFFFFKSAVLKKKAK